MESMFVENRQLNALVSSSPADSTRELVIGELSACLQCFYTDVLYTMTVRSVPHMGVAVAGSRQHGAEAGMRKEAVRLCIVVHNAKQGERRRPHVLH